MFLIILRVEDRFSKLRVILDAFIVAWIECQGRTWPSLNKSEMNIAFNELGTSQETRDSSEYIEKNLKPPQKIWKIEKRGF